MKIRESAGGIIVGPEGKIALVFQHGNSWSFPKGGIENGESPLEAARREIFEECGLSELSLIRELGSYKRYSIAKDGITEDKDKGLRKRTLFLFHTEENELMPRDEEITEVGWFSVDEALKQLTHPRDREFLESIRYLLV
jgi:8-oxo-dGTP pyrophosphatase MutT (NUDIX family)